MILKWYEAKKEMGFYWEFERLGGPGTIIQVFDDGMWGFIGSEEAHFFDEESHGSNYYVKAVQPDIEQMLSQLSYSGLRNFHNANEKSKFPEKVEGYWRQHDVIPTYTGEKCNMKNFIARDGSEYPWPVVWEIPEFDKQLFIDHLADTEDNLAEVKKYRGFSICRLTGANRGCNEYEYGGWRWPGGFIEYVRMGVPPSRAFYAFIMQVEEENCKYLPTYNR